MNAMAAAQALLDALAIPLHADALPALEANRRLLLDHWARLGAVEAEQS